MPKMRRKGDLPQKTCACCGLPFTWRKAWEKVWEEVRYCSDRCRARKAQAGEAQAGEAKAGEAKAGKVRRG